MAADQHETHNDVARLRQFEARCECGGRWRVYRPVTADDDDPMSTCIGCGQDTYDLTDMGEARA